MAIVHQSGARQNAMPVKSAEQKRSSKHLAAITPRSADERVAQRVRADVLGDSRPAGDAADDPGGTVPVQTPLVRSDEQRPSCANASPQTPL